MKLPKWLEGVTFAVQHNPNCSSPFLIRLVGYGAGIIDGNHPSVGTRDALGYGPTLAIAARRARLAKAEQKSGFP